MTGALFSSTAAGAFWLALGVIVWRGPQEASWGALCARCARPSTRNVCRKCRQGLAARADRPARGDRGAGSSSAVHPAPQHLKGKRIR